MNKTKLIKTFEILYPEPESELNFKNTYQLVVSVILSAQCTDKKVNEVTPTLFKDFSSFKKLSEAKISQIEKIIRQVNYYKTKSKNIVNMAKMVIENYKGRLPRKHNELIKLPGVGRKTANVVLGELVVTPTIAVDTHVFRVSQRLGLAKGKTPLDIEKQLMKGFSKSIWRNLHHWLILHGRRVCKAQNPDCVNCEVSELCPSKFL